MPKLTTAERAARAEDDLRRARRDLADADAQVAASRGATYGDIIQAHARHGIVRRALAKATRRAAKYPYPIEPPPPASLPPDPPAPWREPDGDLFD